MMHFVNLDRIRSLRMVRDEIDKLSNERNIDVNVREKSLHLARIALEQNPLLDPKTLAIACLFITLRDEGLLTPNLVYTILNGSASDFSWIPLSRVIEKWRANRREVRD